MKVKVIALVLSLINILFWGSVCWGLEVKQLPLADVVSFSAYGMVKEKADKLPILARGEVLVIGGGPAGIAASLAAAWAGAKVILVERYGYLGGTGTAGGINVFMHQDCVGGVYKEILERLKVKGGRKEGRYIFDPEIMKGLLLEMLSEAGVRVWLRAWSSGVLMIGNVVKGVVVETDTGRGVILSKVLVDATGDGDVAVSCGVPFMMGRKEDGLTQPATLAYMLVKADEKEFKGLVRPIGGTWQFYGGRLLVNATRIACDGVDVFQLTEAEMEGRKQMKEQITELVAKGFVYRALSSGPVVGIRETRQIVGEYILTEEDQKAGRMFPDRIALCNYPIDIHDPLKPLTTRLEEVPLYSIPYRCLVPKAVENLLVAGRCISGTHEAMSSFRIMPTVMAIGQAAGCAAALAVKSRCTPRQVDIKALQELLRQQGAILGDVMNK